VDRKTLISLAKRIEAEQNTKIIKRCSVDPWYWITEWTKTFDEQARDKGVEAYKPFPVDGYQLKVILSILIAGEPAADAAARTWESTHNDEDTANAAYEVALDAIQNPTKYPKEPHIAVPKSRTMMASWTVVAYMSWEGQFHERVRWVLQSKEERTAEDLLSYAKCLYSQQPAWMRERYPLTGGKGQIETEGAPYRRVL
jgi:hypothetical protein